VNDNGFSYILQWKDAEIPGYIVDINPEELNIDDLPESTLPPAVEWKTLYISGGRRDKISKGDIAGLFLKQGEIQKDQLGLIEIKGNCSYAGVQADVAEELIEKTNNSRLKKTR
jgi:hypothetical protein